MRLISKSGWAGRILDEGRGSCVCKQRAGSTYSGRALICIRAVQDAAVPPAPKKTAVSWSCERREPDYNRQKHHGRSSWLVFSLPDRQMVWALRPGSFLLNKGTTWCCMLEANNGPKRRRTSCPRQNRSLLGP